MQTGSLPIAQPRTSPARPSRARSINTAGSKDRTVGGVLVVSWIASDRPSAGAPGPAGRLSLNNSRALPELVVCSTHTPANELVSFTRHKLAPFNRRLWDFYLALNGRDVSHRVETPLFNERSRHCL